MFPTRNFKRLVINTLPIFFVYFRFPQQLENWHWSAYSFREASKNKISIFFVAAVKNLPGFAEFILKLRVRYVPGLEAVVSFYPTVSLAYLETF